MRKGHTAASAAPSTELLPFSRCRWLQLRGGCIRRQFRPTFPTTCSSNQLLPFLPSGHSPKLPSNAKQLATSVAPTPRHWCRGATTPETPPTPLPNLPGGALWRRQDARKFSTPAAHKNTFCPRKVPCKLVLAAELRDASPLHSFTTNSSPGLPSPGSRPPLAPAQHVCAQRRLRHAYSLVV